MAPPRRQRVVSSIALIAVLGCKTGDGTTGVPAARGDANAVSTEAGATASNISDAPPTQSTRDEPEPAWDAAPFDNRDAATTNAPQINTPLTLFYLDVTDDQVMSFDPEDSRPRLLVEGAGRGPDGIAVDPESKQLYWTNMGVPAENDGFILRSDFDGSNLTTIVEAGNTYTPKQIKLDPITRRLYWGDREGMRVMSANLDGSDLQTLVSVAQGARARTDRANHVVGVSVDARSGFVYWIQKGPPNAGKGSIRRAGLAIPEGESHLDRTDIEIMYAGLPEPIDLDVDSDTGMMYWTDRGDGTINRAPVEVPAGETPGTRRDRHVLVRNVDVAIGIWLDAGAGHVYYTGNDVVGRVDLDGANPTTLVTRAGVLTGITGFR